MSKEGNLETPSQIINYYLKQIKNVSSKMYRLKEGWDTFSDDSQWEEFDDGNCGKRMNLLGIRCEWIFEGKNIIKRFSRSQRRRIKKRIETAFRKAEKKHAD